MNFQPDLAAKVMASEKTVTRRLCSENPHSPWWFEKCSLKVGSTYAVCPGRGKNAVGRVRIVSVRRLRLGLLDDEEARREGFRDAAAFERALWVINGSYDQNSQVWRVEFEVVET